MLPNPRHELFAQAVSSGAKGAAAYRRVYGANIGSARQNAHDLLTKPDIQNRVSELQAESATATTLSNQERRELIAKRARAENVKDSDLATLLNLDAKLAGELTEKQEQTIRSDPLAPLVVSLPTLICTPRRRQDRDKQTNGLPIMA